MANAVVPGWPSERPVKIGCPSSLPIGMHASTSRGKSDYHWQQVIEHNGKYLTEITQLKCTYFCQHLKYV